MLNPLIAVAEDEQSISSGRVQSPIDSGVLSYGDLVRLHTTGPDEGRIFVVQPRASDAKRWDSWSADGVVSGFARRLVTKI